MNFVFALIAQATPGVTAGDIFKSVREESAVEINPAKILLFIAAVVGVIVLVSFLQKRANRPPTPAEPNNPSKLLRQLAREAGLNRREIRELKKLAELQGVEHPLTLLLCPSLMQAAIAKRQNAGRPAVR